MVEKVEQVRKLRGWTQVQLEDKADLAKGRISKWLSGKGEPSATDIWRISRHLAVDPIYLLDPDAEEPKPAAKDEYAGVMMMARRLGPEEAERRLLLKPDARHEPAAHDGAEVESGHGTGPRVRPPESPVRRRAY